MAHAGFRFAAIALFGLLALQILRQNRHRVPALVATVFSITLSAYLICSAPFWNDLSSWLQALLLIGCLANPMLFWLLARSIFEDGFRLNWQHVLLLVAIEALGFCYIRFAYTRPGRGVTAADCQGCRWTTASKQHRIGDRRARHGLSRARTRFIPFLYH